MEGDTTWDRLLGWARDEVISTDEAAADVEGDTTWDRLLGWARDEVISTDGAAADGGRYHMGPPPVWPVMT